jgi:signal transduction histidine kinase
MLGGEHRADRPVSGRVRDHFEPGEWPALDEGTSAFPDRAKRWRALVHVRNRDTGEIRALDFAALPVQDDSGRLIASAGVGRDITDQRQSAARTLQRQLMITQDEERRRIAADVHDDTTQALTAVSYRLQRLRRQLNEDERALLADALDATGAALRRLRRLIFDLHPSALDSGGVAAALEQFVSVAFDEFAPIITITAEDDTLSLDRLTRVASYRATREAVINAVQHARASRVEVSVESLGEGLCLRVVDDGIGFDPTALPARPGHLGMAGARDLIEAAGGVLDLHSAPGRGTAVQVWIG